MENSNPSIGTNHPFDVEFFFKKVSMLFLSLLRTIVDWVCSFYYNFAPISWLPKKNIEDKLVLITGAGKGLGRLLSLRFSKLKTRLILCDIDMDNLNKTKELCQMEGTEDIHIFQVDLSNRKEIYAFAEKAKDIGNPDILVNNAGILRDGGPYIDKNDEWIEKTFQVNTLAHMWMAKAFLPKMIENNNGHIVTLASLGGIVGAFDITDYSASKFGALGFHEALENEMFVQGHDGLNFTIVCPSYINTDMISQIPLSSETGLLSAEDVVDSIMAAVLAEMKILLLPRDAYFLYALKGLLPRRSFQRFLIWNVTKKS